MRDIRYRLLVLVGAGFGLVLLAQLHRPAQAAPHFVWPWAGTEGWRYTQGFHLDHALDFQPQIAPNCDGDPVDLTHTISPVAPGTVTAIRYRGPPEPPLPVSLTIDHGGGWSSYYTHLANVPEAVAAIGAHVDYTTDLGNPSCYSGCNPGLGPPCATGRHVHFQIRKDGSGAGILQATICGWTVGSDSGISRDGVTYYPKESGAAPISNTNCDGSATRTPTPAPTATDGLDFSISVAGSSCDSNQPDAACSVPETFTLSFSVNSIPSSFRYLAYDWQVQYSGLDIVPKSLVQTVWPECRPVPRAPEALDLRASCAVDTGTGSTYTGPLLHVDFRCPAGATTGTITLLNTVGHTDLIDGTFTPHVEALDESLTIYCPGAATFTPTNTPTNTPTPTHTPTPTFTPTPTLTPTPLYPAGDARCDGVVNAIDALLVLQYTAGYPPSWCKAYADANRDGTVNAIDATLILQYAAGLIPHLPP